MGASWFREPGYRKADPQNTATLLSKPFFPGAERPVGKRSVRCPLPYGPGKAIVTALINGWCMAQNLAYARVKRAASEFGDFGRLHEADMCDATTDEMIQAYTEGHEEQAHGGGLRIEGEGAPRELQGACSVRAWRRRRAARAGLHPQPQAACFQQAVVDRTPAHA
jgi:hypothetical protein